MNNTKTEQKILDFINQNFEVSTRDIVEFLKISPQATHKHLKKLVEENKLKKMGNPPRVFYKIGWFQEALTRGYVLALTRHLKEKAEQFQFNNSTNYEDEYINQIKILKSGLKQKLQNENYLDYVFKELTDDNYDFKKLVSAPWYADFLWVSLFLEYKYIFITPQGEIYNGWVAFALWCSKRNLPLSKTFVLYSDTIEKYSKFKTSDDAFVVATNKFKNTFSSDTQVDEVYYCDFYSIEIFGKTKLGNLLLHGKQSQNLKIIHQVCFAVKERITDFIKKNAIDAIAFVPPTTPRKPQFMDEFRKVLDLHLPAIKLEKVVNEIAIQQKTLKSSADRIENAQNTIFVDEKRSFKNILLLDDAVGSGSTFNEIARKIRKKQILKASGKIFALAIVGSANGIIDSQKNFEVISEV